jgi:NADH dehydrogenase
VPGERPPILILGAGYAGLRLAESLPRRGDRRIPPVRVIDRSSFHTVRTELYEVDRMVQGSGLAHWIVPLADRLVRRGIDFTQAEVRDIDLDSRTVRTDHGSLSYSFVAICLGSIPNDFGIPGVREHLHSPYTLRGALALADDLRRRIDTLPPSTPLRVVVAGGGATGTQLAAEIRCARWKRTDKRTPPAPQVQILTGPTPFLEGLPEPLVRKAREILEREGIQIRDGVSVRRVEAQKLETDHAGTISYDVGVWCAGVRAPDVAAHTRGPHSRGGRILVDPYLRVPGFPEAFAAGDCMDLRDPETGIGVPATAQAALAASSHAAANIRALIEGKPLTPFVYKEAGVILPLGRGEGVARLYRLAPVWGHPAAILNTLREEGYRLRARFG